MALIHALAPAASAPSNNVDSRVDFETDPTRYHHWQLSCDGAIATLTMDIDEDAGIRPGYKLKLNSYDLGVDIELHDALQRIRFEHPEVKTVVLTSGKERIFCSGANIYMLGLSSHAWKVNFCKFTNETRNGIEHSSAKSGLKFIAAVNGSCAGGGYEIALACDEILMIDDRSSAVSLPEVPLLGVLPGTGGLTRLTDKRKVRRDLADVFCTSQEGQRAERAKAWKLIDDYAKPAEFAAFVKRRAESLAASSDRPGDAKGVALTPLKKVVDAVGYHYECVDVAIDRAARVATITVHAPKATVEGELDAMLAAGADWYPLRFARELDDAILMLRTADLEVGTWVLKSRGDANAVLAADAALRRHRGHWFAREVLNLQERVFARLDVSSRSMIALVDSGSCFAGSFLEIALAADRSYMLGSEEESAAPTITLTDANFGDYLEVNELTRLSTRFCEDTTAIASLKQLIGKPLTARKAEEAGLVTFAPDDIDWNDEIRLAIEERTSLSPDALTGMEASLRFTGKETMETRIFGRLSAWQNWIFIRPNAVGEGGALKIFGSGKRPDFDWKRV